MSSRGTGVQVYVNVRGVVNGPFAAAVVPSDAQLDPPSVERSIWKFCEDDTLWSTSVHVSTFVPPPGAPSGGVSAITGAVVSSVMVVVEPVSEMLPAASLAH